LADQRLGAIRRSDRGVRGPTTARAASSLTLDPQQQRQVVGGHAGDGEFARSGASDDGQADDDVVLSGEAVPVDGGGAGHQAGKAGAQAARGGSEFGEFVPTQRTTPVVLSTVQPPRDHR
jgi:hypothetical protein